MTDELSRRRDLNRDLKEAFGDAREITFPCSFCGGDTTKGDIATFTLLWRDKEQYWFGHAQCFIDALEPQFRDLRPEWVDHLHTERETDDAS